MEFIVYFISSSQSKASQISASTIGSSTSGNDPSLEEMSTHQCVQQLDMCKVLQEKIRKQEAEHNSLIIENEKQRQQYERCLDDIANQVVNALLAQKVNDGRKLLSNMSFSDNDIS